MCVLVILKRQSELMPISLALQPAGRLADIHDGRQSQ